jgi:uncharacterized protein
MPPIDRRDFLRAAALTGGAFALEGLVRRGVLAAQDRSTFEGIRRVAGYGPLTQKPALNTGEKLLALPDNFQYKVIGREGAKMSDGFPTPPMHDGMAAFPDGRYLRLVRNQEINNQRATEPLSIGGPKHAYDPLAGGGTTTLVIDPATREVVRDFCSLSGTLQNCAGGPTPWGSWISCEETVLGPERRFLLSRGRTFGGFEKHHGYCFEVPAKNDGVIDPVPIKAMGRFVHEAVAVDPASGYVYETEDFNPSGFYRFIPNKRGDLRSGGKLQMLAVTDRTQYDTRTGQKIGAAFAAGWVDIEEPDPKSAELDQSSVYKQGLAKGGATFSRLEGCWYGNGRVYLDATNGGDAKLGQIWAYEPKTDTTGTLTLLFESPDRDVLDRPDNLCVSPRGGLVICENGEGQPFIRGLTREGAIFNFARDLSSDPSEFAGATFSPGGQTLFVNLQKPGATFAIWGEWRSGLL